MIEANNETLVESLHPRKKEKRHKNLKNPDPSLLQPPIGLANDHVESPDEEEDAGDDGGDIAFEWYGVSLNGPLLAKKAMQLRARIIIPVCSFSSKALYIRPLKE